MRKVFSEAPGVKYLLVHDDIDNVRYTDIVTSVYWRTCKAFLEKYYLVYEDYKLEEEDYLKAKENLKFFKYIGNVDNVENFLKVLLSNVPVNSLDYRSVNIFKKDKNLIQNIKNSMGDIIQEYNYYDTKLLEIIKTKFS